MLEKINLVNCEDNTEIIDWIYYEKQIRDISDETSNLEQIKNQFHIEKVV